VINLERSRDQEIYGLKKYKSALGISINDDVPMGTESKYFEAVRIGYYRFDQDLS
jgi:hypothetical protein